MIISFLCFILNFIRFSFRHFFKSCFFFFFYFSNPQIYKFLFELINKIKSSQYKMMKWKLYENCRLHFKTQNYFFEIYFIRETQNGCSSFIRNIKKIKNKRIETTSKNGVSVLGKKKKKNCAHKLWKKLFSISIIWSMQNLHFILFFIHFFVFRKRLKIVIRVFPSIASIFNLENSNCSF